MVIGDHRLSWSVWSPVAIPVLLLGWACTAEAPPLTHAVRDSADVEIVESFAMGWEEGREWTVGSEAILRIGVVEGDPDYQLDRLVGAVMFSEGTVALGDFGSQEVRMFSPAGAFLRTVGREGGGPGEFTGMSGMGMGQENRAWVYDFSLRRITWIDSSGEILQQVQLGPEPPVLNPVGPLPDGTFVLRQLWGATAVSESGKSGFRRDPIAYVRFDSNGELVDTLGLFPGRELLITEEDGRGVMGSAPLGRTSSSTIRGDRLVVGSQETFELGEYESGGSLLRIVRIPNRDLVTSPQDIEAYIQGQLKGVSEELRNRAREEIASRPMPPTRPAYGQIMPDHLGNLWVAAYAPFPTLPRSWSVFDPEARWLGDVVMPSRFLPMEIGPGWILGMERDELDVERVALYPLLKR